MFMGDWVYSLSCTATQVHEDAESSSLSLSILSMFDRDGINPGMVLFNLCLNSIKSLCSIFASSWFNASDSTIEDCLWLVIERARLIVGWSMHVKVANDRCFFLLWLELWFMLQEFSNQITSTCWRLVWCGSIMLRLCDYLTHNWWPKTSDKLMKTQNVR